MERAGDLQFGDRNPTDLDSSVHLTIPCCCAHLAPRP
jgi:hypothetical protein